MFFSGISNYFRKCKSNSFVKHRPIAPCFVSRCLKWNSQELNAISYSILVGVVMIQEVCCDIISLAHFEQTRRKTEKNENVLCRSGQSHKF